MPTRIIIIVTLLIATVGSYWLLNQVLENPQEVESTDFYDPDYYLEDFTTLSMNDNGTPKNKLYAVYMAHYPDNDTSELLKPQIEIFRENKLPLFVKSEKGWVTGKNEVILLHGNVKMWENDDLGNRALQVDTSEVRVLLDEDYAETDQYATIKSKRTTITGKGMRAYFNDSRLEVIHHEKTIIEQPRT